MSNPFSDRPHFLNYNEALFQFGTGVETSPSVINGLKRVLTDIEMSRDYAGNLWGYFDQKCSGEFGVIRHGLSNELQALLRSICASNLTHGFLQGKFVYDRLLQSREDRVSYGSIALDRLLCLAEAVGAIRAPSPMHGQRTVEIKNPDGIFKKIEEAVGFSLPAPQQDGALYGLRLHNGIYSDRHFEAIYTAWRVKEIVGPEAIKSKSIVEIGGGGGHLAYYMRLFGCRHYAIVDLPQAQIAQYLILASDLGTDKVSLSTNGGEIELIRAQTPRSATIDTFDIVINVDSLPEMPPSVAQEYVNQIGTGRLFVSINQESGVMNGSYPQSVVSELAANASLKRISRHPSWMRTGYVEEVFTR